MKNKLWFLVKEGLKKKLNSKSFKIVNILLLIGFSLLINIDSIIKYFGGDFDETTNIYVIDNTNYSAYDMFENMYNSLDTKTISQSEVKLFKSEKTKEELINEIKEEEKKDIIIEINESLNTIEANVVSYEYVDSMLYQNIYNVLNNTKTSIALSNTDIDKEKLAEIYETIQVNRVFINEEMDENEEMLNTFGTILIPVFIMPFFLLIIFSIQMIGAEINEEKTSKSMEIIISSVPPRTHFLSKILSVNLFVLIQFVLLLIYGIVGLSIRTGITGSSLINSFGSDITPMVNTFMSSDLWSNILKGIPFIVILFILSFLAYSFLASILASMTTSIEDFQQLQTPMMLLVLVGYYLAIMASTYQNATFITIFSMVPFISALLAPVLFIMGQIGLIEIIVSIVLLIIVLLLFLKYGIRIYKAGILNYSSNKLWKKMFKSIKN